MRNQWDAEMSTPKYNLKTTTRCQPMQYGRRHRADGNTVVEARYCTAGTLGRAVRGTLHLRPRPSQHDIADCGQSRPPTRIPAKDIPRILKIKPKQHTAPCKLSRHLMDCISIQDEYARRCTKLRGTSSIGCTRRRVSSTLMPYTFVTLER